MLNATIKRNVIFLLLTIAVFLCFGYMTWRQMLWRQQAMIKANFAAKLLAESYYDKGKLIKLELVVKDKPEEYQDKSFRFDGPYVVFDWIGYIDPLCRFIKSPNILVSEEFVKAYNAKMNEIVSDPNKYERWNREEISYWQKNVLSKPPSELKNDSNNQEEKVKEIGIAHSDAPVIIVARIIELKGCDKYCGYDIEIINVIRNSIKAKLDSRIMIQKVGYENQPQLNKTYILELDHYNGNPKDGLKILRFKEK